MNTKDIENLIEIMNNNNLAEIEYEKDGIKLRLRKEETQIVNPPNNIIVENGDTRIFKANNTQNNENTEDLDNLPAENTINSPLVGTFYQSSAPGEAPFVDIGDEVNEDTVVCIVEAMKVMNEVKAEKKGVIEAIIVEDAQPVEFNQPLFKIKPLS